MERRKSKLSRSTDIEVPGSSSECIVDSVKRSRRSVSGSSSTSHCLSSSFSVCPVCGVSIRPNETVAHFEQEVLRLDQVKQLTVVKRAARATSTERSSIKKSLEERRAAVKNVRRNRSRRLTYRTGPPHLLRRLPGEIQCPVCQLPLGHLEDFEQRNQHVESCLTQNGPSTSRTSIAEDEVDVETQRRENDVDVEGDEEMEEYEWAGQTRIRTNALGNAIPRSNATGAEEDVDEDLDVDGDEESQFGEPQFTEADMIPTSNDDATIRIREAIVTTTAGANDGTPSGLPSKWSTIEDLSRVDQEQQDVPAWQSEQINDLEEPTTSTGSKRSEKRTGNVSSVLVESLKARIRELEVQLSKFATKGCKPPETAEESTEDESSDKRLVPASSSDLCSFSRCLICLDNLSSPLVSVACWHVYCQDCWLKTLSCKKMCPQCSIITSAKDLRRIFL